jgi:threonine synthase
LNSFILKKFRENFLSGSVTEREIENTMNSVLKDCGELICPHTAIGVNVAKKENSFINDTTMITLATAHPAKFPDAVTKFTGRAPVLPSRYSELFSRKEVMISVNNSVDQIQRIISERTLH